MDSWQDLKTMAMLDEDRMTLLNELSDLQDRKKRQILQETLFDNNTYNHKRLSDGIDEQIKKIKARIETHNQMILDKYKTPTRPRPRSGYVNSDKLDPDLPPNDAFVEDSDTPRFPLFHSDENDSESLGNKLKKKLTQLGSIFKYTKKLNVDQPVPKEKTEPKKDGLFAKLKTAHKEWLEEENNKNKKEDTKTTDIEMNPAFPDAVVKYIEETTDENIQG